MLTKLLPKEIVCSGFKKELEDKVDKVKKSPTQSSQMGIGMQG